VDHNVEITIDNFCIYDLVFSVGILSSMNVIDRPCEMRPLICFNAYENHTSPGKLHSFHVVVNGKTGIQKASWLRTARHPPNYV
jgi:hypothetical protein